MNLKDYQNKVLEQLKIYLSSLSDYKKRYEKLLDADPDIAMDFNYPKRAWVQTTGKEVYHSKTNGLKEHLPDIYFKVPTGGGKTLLACHAIDLIQRSYLNKQTGLVLWIVPSSQIYRQTIQALKSREHPYRQVLDISSGGRTLIKEKTEIFTRLDVTENLVVLLLMLPSANRQVKETLKVFKDSGGFTDFFPPEDNYPAQRDLLQLFPNLDCFGEKDEVFNTQVKTSLGNTLKLLKPLVIIDEGHRAYGDNARHTITSFNPSFVLELSATPPDQANKLVEITGKALNEEEMIKLDIHLINKTSLDWKNTMLATIEKQKELEEKAKEYEGHTGEYIRPICLIQVERTGKDQRDKHFIHAEDVKEFLIKKCNIAESNIAIKSSEKDDIEGIDLFSKECEIRYIITKQALQEGWDCSFAYILTILTNPNSATGITQLVGRILRQPNARKTKVKELDECYVFTFRQNASTLVREIKSGLEDEGLGDIAGRIVNDEDGTDVNVLRERTVEYRTGFKKFEGKIYLPKFIIQENKSWRDINYEADILSAIDWESMDISEMKNITLQKKKLNEQEIPISLSDDEHELLKAGKTIRTEGSLEIDEVFLTRQITEVVPNPWICYQIAEDALKIVLKKYDREIVAANFIFVIEELKKILEKEKEKLSEGVFRSLIQNKKLFFFLIEEKGHHLIPSHVKVKSNKQMVRGDNSPIQKSLFDYVPEENVNELEKSVAIYLDEQEKLLWWYRNMSRQDYHIQGWKKNKIYPDFVATKAKEKDATDYGNVFVLETKGLHLKNEDTKYKQSVFALCSKMATKKAWTELFDEFPDHDFEFQVVFENEWENKINKLFV